MYLCDGFIRILHFKSKTLDLHISTTNDGNDDGDSELIMMTTKMMMMLKHFEKDIHIWS